MNSLIRRYITPKTMVLADQAIISGGSFITNVIIARKLGPADYGLYSIVVLAQLFILSLQQAGITGIYQVIFPKLSQSKRDEYTGTLFYTQCMLLVLLLLISAIAYVFLSPVLKSFSPIFIPAVSGILLFLLQDFLRKILLTQQKFVKTLWIDAINNLLQLLILVLWFSFSHLTLLSACWIICLTFIIPCILGIVWIKPGVFLWKDVKSCIADHFKKAKWLLCSALLQWGAGNYFILAAGWWLGPASLAALRLSQYIFGLLNVVLQAIENYALPIASAIDTSRGKLAVYAKSVSKKSFLLMLPLLIVIVLFPKYIIQVLGGKAYTDYYYLLYYLSAAYLFVIGTIPLKIFLRVKLLNRAYFTGYLFTVVFSILSANFLIKTWQLKGVLVGLILSQVILTIYWLVFLFNKKSNYEYYSPGVR